MKKWLSLQSFSMRLLFGLIALIGLTTISAGIPAYWLTRTQLERQAWSQVVGDYSRSSISLLSIAPTTERVITEKPCPVLIARGASPVLQRVLICEGGRDPSLLKRLINLSPSLLAGFTELTILHVMSQIMASPAVQD